MAEVISHQGLINKVINVGLQAKNKAKEQVQ
jgi:hypothetical protein